MSELYAMICKLNGKDGLNIDNETIELFNKDYNLLKIAEANKILDAKFKLLPLDLLNESEICTMFKQLDERLRYSEMMFLAALIPSIIYNIGISEEWNIVNKWDGKIKNTKQLKKEDILADLLSNHFDYRYRNTSMAEFIHKKVFNGKTEEELEDLSNKLNDF
jgi:hypothetical protein